MDLILIREIDYFDNDWLVVAEPYAGMEREITRIRWTEDLKHWMNQHRAQDFVTLELLTPLLD